MIRASDRVATVLARDERLIEVFTGLASAFARLRKPGMRKVMGRLVTIEQAAKIAGVEPGLLIERLNAALDEGTAGEMEWKSEPRSVPGTESGDGGAPVVNNFAPQRAPGVDRGGAAGSEIENVAPESLAGGRRTDRYEMGSERMVLEADNVEAVAGMPPALAAIPAELIVDIDVRPDLRRGEEPFSKIMAALREVPPGGILRLCATFEPVPLYAVLGKQGFEHWTERFADDDWRVWFYAPPSETAAEAPAPAGTVAVTPATASTENPTPPAESSPAAPPAVTAEPAVITEPALAAESAEDDVVILDVRNLEPPEPMMRTFAALEQLPVGKTLLQINVRVPQFLLPQLAERGFTYQIREQSKDLVRIFIRHAAVGE